MQLRIANHAPAVEQPDRAPVALIPCSAGSVRNWQPMIERLGGFATVPVELYGHGSRSERPLPLTLADEAMMVMEQVPADRQVHLVGHSYGGAVALKIARNWPERLLSLTLIEPSSFHILPWPLEGVPAPLDEIWQVASSVARDVREDKKACAMETFIDFWSGKRTWATMSVARQLRLTQLAGHIPNHFRSLFEEPASGLDYASIEVPTLILCGTRSPRASRQISRLLAEMLPNVRHRTIRDAGHMSPTSHPVEVHAHVTEHLDNVMAIAA